MADDQDPPTAVAARVIARRPSLWLLLRIWGAIGFQSFGGGASTVFLIRRAFVERSGWLSEEEFALSWNLCLMAPGINLVALTVLIGRKLGGNGGIAASLAGLLLPSAAITCLLTAGFQVVQRLPAIQAMLHGVVPATGGIMLVVAVRFFQPLLKQGRQEGIFRLVITLLIIMVVGAAVIIFKVPVALLIIGAALAGVLLFRNPPATASMQPQPPAREEL
ncbi:MAG: chromate transporter [Chloroflexota bacterium]|nr:chromate transporter [Chloroflexota bacterium]